jgi:aminoglycoside phosphotransferase
MEIINVPQKINEYTKEMVYEKNEVGCSKAKLYHLIDKDKEYYLKVEKTNHIFEHEQKIMQWLQGRLPVPKIVAQCSEQGVDYLLMTKAIGEMAISEQYLKNPVELVRLLAAGIKMLQEVRVLDCPFDYSLKNTLEYAGERVKNGKVDMNDWKENTKRLYNSPKALYDYLIANQPEEELVFSHGDYCLPNVFFDNGKATGFIDLGSAGIADKWQDIATCVRSLEFNLKSKEYTNLFFECLAIKPDYKKIEYYLLLNELFE